MSTADRLASILDVLDLLRPGCTAEITPEAVAEARRAVVELARKPAASAEGTVREIREVDENLVTIVYQPAWSDGNPTKLVFFVPAWRGVTCNQRVHIDVYAVDDKPSLPPSPPLAESTTIVHPDDGDGPWVQPPRMAVPRSVPGSRVRVVVMGDEPGEE